LRSAQGSRLCSVWCIGSSRPGPTSLLSSG
jgi:hypothetical protein